MRILVVTNLFPSPYLPNRAPFNRQQFRLLGERHTVEVIAPIAWTEELRARRRGIPALPRNRLLELDGLHVDHPRFYFPPKILQRAYGRLFEVSVGPTFRRRVAALRPDLVFASWAYPDGWAAVRLARRAGLPVVVQIHGSDVLVLADSPARHRLTFDALRAADGVVAVSRDLAGRAIEEGVDPGKVKVLYGGVDPALFNPGSKQDARVRLGEAGAEPLVLFVGNLVAVKGVDVLIEACATLARAGARFQCRVIGQGSLSGALTAQIARLGISERVKLIGPKPQSELPDWYRASDLFVLPSHSEGVPNVLREASACGLRCVATSVGGIPEIVDCGDIRLVPPADPAVLAATMRSALADSDKPTRFPPARTRAEAIDELETFLACILERAGRTLIPA